MVHKRLYVLSAVFTPLRSLRLCVIIFLLKVRPEGADGQDRQSIQGHQGGLGTSSWTDGFGTVPTTGSVQFGNDMEAYTSTNAETIRFNNGVFEGCDGTAWERSS